MKSQIARFVGTLYTRTRFITDVTNQLPPRFGNPIHAVDGFHENMIRNVGLWNP